MNIIIDRPASVKGELALKVWREAIAPQLTLAQLERLHGALLRDDPCLIQGATTDPHPIQVTRDWPCVSGCLIAFPLMEDGDTVADVEESFFNACHAADQVMGECAVTRYLTEAWDETPRAEAFALLLPAVEKELERRKKEPSAVDESRYAGKK